MPSATACHCCDILDLPAPVLAGPIGGALKIVSAEPAIPCIFDGHNDVLLRLWMKNRPDVHQDFIDGDGLGHLDLPRMRRGGFAGGYFAIFVPPDPMRKRSQARSVGAAATQPDSDDVFAGMAAGGSYDLALPPPLDVADALQVVLDQAAILLRIETASQGQVKICTDAAQIRSCIDAGILAVVMHIEGAEAIDDDFNNLELLHRAGLRSVGPVWSRPTRFAHGVPFRFPSSPDTGPGLTDLGKELVRALNAMNMVIDLSHINEKGFWDVQRLSDAPLVATHSNVHTLCPTARNLTDSQLDAIKDSDGMVGVNFATAFIRADGRMTADTPVQQMLQHVDYLIDRLGEHAVGFGSDFDGAVVPQAIGDVAGLPVLYDAMIQHGYDDALIEKVCHENWTALLQRTIG